MGTQTIKVTVDDSNLGFFLELLDKFNFIVDIQTTGKSSKKDENNLTSEINKPKGKPSIMDFAGLWEKNPKTIDQLREKAWKRD